ncbi:hypothetical protein Aperf_G00000053505 [Anoplocephala perfoliata]
MAAASGQADYGYGPTNGPHTWSLTCPTAAGAHQSPINIIKSNCRFDSKLSPFKIYVSLKGSKTLIRKKHNFQVNFKSDRPTKLEGGPLKTRYNFVQLHYHWGCGDDWGSEHQIDGRGYAAELHLVFVKENYKSMDQASTDPEGLCVVGIFLKASHVGCLEMEPLFTAMKSSKPGGETRINENIDISHFIPDTSRYYSYEGSLSTPPCMECVRWIVCEEPLRLSKDQLATLRLMHSCDTCNTIENARPPIAAGNRLVVCSFPQKY